MNPTFAPLALLAGLVFHSPEARANPSCSEKVTIAQAERADLAGKARAWFMDREEPRDFFDDPRFKRGLKGMKKRGSKIGVPALAAEYLEATEERRLLSERSSELGWELIRKDIELEKLSQQAKRLSQGFEPWRREELRKRFDEGSGAAIDWLKQEMGSLDSDIEIADQALWKARSKKAKDAALETREHLINQRSYVSQSLAHAEQLPTFEKELAPLREEAGRYKKAAEAAEIRVQEAAKALTEGVRAQFELDDVDSNRSIQVQMDGDKLQLCDSIKLLSPYSHVTTPTAGHLSSCASIDLEDNWIEAKYIIESRYKSVSIEVDGEKSRDLAGILFELDKQVMKQQDASDAALVDCRKAAPAATAAQGQKNAKAAGAL